MGAIADLAALTGSAVGGGIYNRVVNGNVSQQDSTNFTEFAESDWRLGNAPSTAVALTSASADAVPLLNPGGSTQLWLPRIEMAATHSITGAQSHEAKAWSLLLIDRLSHQGGLSGTSTLAQTTNLPTAALTRYTDGVGVMAAVELYSAVGTTATTFTASYTNQAGTSGRTTPAVPIGGATTSYPGDFVAAGGFRILPLQQSDTGVRAVASVTLAATTGSAGNFGVVLFKPLAFVTIYEGETSSIDFALGHGFQMPEIKPSAYLQWLVWSPVSANATSSSTTTYTSYDFVEA